MKKFLSNKNIIRYAFVMMAVACVVIVLGLFAAFSQADTNTVVLPSCSKPLPEGYTQSVQPNVLLLLDTSGSMMYRSDSDTSTYGDGSKPYKYNNNVYRYFGRDLDSSNNNPNTAYNYHPNLVYIDDSDLTDISQSYRDEYFAKSGNRYLYPNDSRMYKLKLVLWEILNDPGLVSGLRMGLATYYQQHNVPPKVPSVGVYYQWPPIPSGSNQALSWEGSSSWDRALLRRFFKSTDEPGSIEEIAKWVDGIEASDNPELRAHGATPLAASIFDNKQGHQSHTNQAPYYGDVRDFFTMTDPSDNKKKAITAWCQQNWLIVLTDGADTQTSPHDTSPVTAVKNLYNLKIDVKVGSGNTTNTAEPIRTMVIGLINPTAPNVSTLKNTLRVCCKTHLPYFMVS
jgi:type IV pilus assembly protein PilY1